MHEALLVNPYEVALANPYEVALAAYKMHYMGHMTGVEPRLWPKQGKEKNSQQGF